MILSIITPGPTLTIYQDGKRVIEGKLSALEALSIIRDLAREEIPMTRATLPTRRPNATASTEWSGHAFTVTIGFDPVTGAPLEVFADRPKVDGMAATLSDACVVISIALQHGITARDLSKSLGRVPAFTGPDATLPASPVGAIVEAIMKEVWA